MADSGRFRIPTGRIFNSKDLEIMRKIHDLTRRRPSKERDELISQLSATLPQNVSLSNDRAMFLLRNLNERGYSKEQAEKILNSDVVKNLGFPQDIPPDVLYWLLDEDEGDKTQIPEEERDLIETRGLEEDEEFIFSSSSRD